MLYASRMPSSARFLTAEWRYLAMLNYEIDPVLLQPLVPAGTELDQWEGRTFVSIVGFLFLDTRVLGLPIPFHRNFEEVNLRFYVRRKADDGWRRAVVFVKELVPRRAIAWTARALYNENYVALPMGHRHAFDASSGELTGASYWWRHRGREDRIDVTVSGPSQPIAEGSQEEFITEHYWGYVRQRDGSTVEYRVEHPRWNVWTTASSRFDCDVATLYGDEFSGPLAAAPSSAFLADGSPVTVQRGVRLSSLKASQPQGLKAALTCA
jgi:uncharacterized protein YqjF (DUF2071 family)